MNWIDMLYNLNNELYKNYNNLHKFYQDNSFNYTVFFREIYSLCDWNNMFSQYNKSEAPLDVLVFNLQNIQSETNLKKRYDYLAQTQKLCYLIKLYTRLISQSIFILQNEDKYTRGNFMILFLNSMKIINEIIANIIDIEIISLIDSCEKNNLLKLSISNFSSNIDEFYEKIKLIISPLTQDIKESTKYYEENKIL